MNFPTRISIVRALALAVATASVARAQQTSTGATVRLSLDDALRLAQTQSQSVEIARAGVVRATGQQEQARSQYLPQLNAAVGYNRTLASQFSSFAAGAAPADTAKPVLSSICAPAIPANATADQRAAALAQAASCQSSNGAGFDLSKTSFGARNQYSLGLSFSQNVFTGGRISAQNEAAGAQLRSAGIEVTSQRAQAALDATSAYYDAALADQLATIADSSVAETEAVLAQTRVSKQVGNASEYELLRATVTRDNQVAVQIQARSNRDVAYLNLKRVLNMPLDTRLELTTSIGDSMPAMPSIAGVSGARASTVSAPDTASADRAPVRELDEAVRAQEAQVRIAKSERIPSLSIVSSYQRLYFPAQAFPSLSAGVNNWTLGLSTNFPILDGGRIRGDELVAQAGLEQTRAQREQTRQFAALDTRVALNALAQAEATWNASVGTVDQARRAYAIDQVRYREGISTQTDLTQSRLLLEQALANRAQAARNFAVARVKLALLRDLPLQASGGATSTQGASGAAQQQPSPQQPSQQTQQQRSQTSNPMTGGSGQP